MRKALITLALLGSSLLLGCNTSQGCNTHCDCTDTSAPLKCPGEWACVNGSCEYQCRSQCAQLPYTCAADESCNGSICSVRQCR